MEESRSETLLFYGAVLRTSLGVAGRAEVPTAPARDPSVSEAVGKVPLIKGYLSLLDTGKGWCPQRPDFESMHIPQTNIKGEKRDDTEWIKET